MLDHAELTAPPPNIHRREQALAEIRRIIEHASHLLPAQGPITVFIHHNTLHAFEELSFDEAVKQGTRAFGCEPYMSEEQYREELRKGRIRFSELREVLDEDLGDRGRETISPFDDRLNLRMAMLQHRPRFGAPEEFAWLVAESDSLRKFLADVSATSRTRLLSETRRWVLRDLGVEAARRNGHARNGSNGVSELFESYGESNVEEWDEDTWEAFTLRALWRICRDGVAAATTPVEFSTSSLPLRHRDLLLRTTGEDADLSVHEILVRFSAAFLDQGLASRRLPRRESGFYHAFIYLYSQRGGPPNRRLRGLAAELARLKTERIEPLESIRESLELLGVPEEEWKEFISASLTALRGWGGMIEQVEARGDRVSHPIPEDSLIEFLAIRLLLDRLAIANLAKDSLGFHAPLKRLREELRSRAEPDRSTSPEQKAFLIFQLAQIFARTPEELSRLDSASWANLVEEIDSFSALERRRVFHLAFERRLYFQTLDALSRRSGDAPPRRERPRFQAITCIDEREESFRRHIEEVAPDAETFGAAGFFAVAMYYRGAADAQFTPLCPIIIRPKHWVAEQVDESAEHKHRRRAKTRRILGLASNRFHIGSRSFASGAILSAGIGVLSSIPLVARILFPRLTGLVRRSLGRVIQTPPATRLRLERKDSIAGPENGGLGFSLEEMIGIGERLLRDIALVKDFSRLIFVFGHGSSSLNNPHSSAYDCGACGGNSGAPNGRALAEVLNDPRVREGLAARGIVIPSDTWVVGGLHNTCNDSVTYFDADRVPETHRPDFERAVADFEIVQQRNAQERCRRFVTAPLKISPAAALAHVEARSEDLAQTRPELGHATNAICVVARRKRSQGLYFDRRAFLVSHDPLLDDDEGTILSRTLSAVFPVCGGINLEYYFSRVDSPGYGCGTKLPHNVTSLLGVMDGAASDLRTGLPWQMVEIHEPVRLLIVVEVAVEIMRGIMDRFPVIGNMIRKEWVRLALLDPGSAKILMFQNGDFRDYRPKVETLPRASSSHEWYRGRRDHLEFAEIITASR